MSFVLDQKTVFDEFNSVITPGISDQLRPHIAGAHAELHRYSNALEKPLIGLGAYQPGSTLLYNWPGKDPASTVDLTYVQLWIDNALLLFFQHTVGSGSVVTPQGLNQVLNSGTGFQAAPGFPRDILLKDRDVRKGDVVKLWTDPAQPFWTYVADLVPDIVAPLLGAATADPGNAPAQTASADFNQTGGGHNQIVGSADGTGYNGLATGDIGETYTITCTTGGDPTAARLNITSASGRDDVPNVTPAAFGAPTTIGSRGLYITFNLDNTRVSDAGVTVNQFVVGQTWQVIVRQAFTQPAAAAGGTYIGTETGVQLTYTARVSRGGSLGGATPPQITVTRSDGTDSSGPSDILASGQSVPLGSLGLTLTFTGTALRAGDVYYLTVQSQSLGAYRTLLLGQNMPPGLANAADLNLALYIRKNVEVPAFTSGANPIPNWSATQDGLTVNANLLGYDASLLDGGLPFGVPVQSDATTQMYAHYRAWRDTFTGKVISLRPESTQPAAVLAAVQGSLGTVDPDNPLAYAVHKTLLNANGTAVYFSAVGDPNVFANWQTVPPMLEGMKDLLSLVPLSNDPAVHTLWRQHCVDRSQDSVGGEWRSCWLPLAAQPTVPVVNAATPSVDNATLLGTLTANTNVVGSPLNLFTCTTGNGRFVTNGVRPGDVLRYLFTVDQFGNTDHQEFLVAQVVNEDTLVLTTAAASAVTTPQALEIWRNPTKDQMVQAMVGVIQTALNKRVRYVWPDLAGYQGISVPGYHLCAALAGLVSGVAPHQSIRNVSLTGFDDVSASSVGFTHTQLNALVAAGCVVVLQDVDGKVYTAWARTTDPSSIDNFEEMAVRNDDAFAHYLYRQCQGFFGQTNITATGLAKIQAGMTAALSFVRGSTLIDRIGTMISDGRIQSLAQHPTQLDRIVVTVSRTRPYPANEATIMLVM